jgi:hypothetical protein
MRNINAALLFLFSATINHAVTIHEKKPWTFLVYLAADNTLNGEADPNIAQMVRTSSNSNVNILVYLNIKRDGEEKKTQKLVIQNGKIIQEGATTVEDSGAEQTFIKALTWAVTEYPSDHIVVDLWNHGSGSLNRCLKERGVCYDDTTGNYLTDLKYKSALENVMHLHRGGKKFDIIAFDACLMADIEVAYTLANYADYVANSQQTVPGPGYNYSYVLSLFGHQTPEPLTLAHWIVSQYDRYYKASGQSYTFSLIDLSKMQEVVNSTNGVANLLKMALENSATAATVIADCAALPNCPHFDEPTYIDLYTFYNNLHSKITSMQLDTTLHNSLNMALSNARSALKAAILANFHSSDFAKAQGMSIYFADTSVGMEPSYMNLYWTYSNPQWASFLNQYLNSN